MQTSLKRKRKSLSLKGLASLLINGCQPFYRRFKLEQLLRRAPKHHLVYRVPVEAHPERVRLV